MKASEIIAILQKEIDKRGDVEVYLWGTWGTFSVEFEVIENRYLLKQHQKMINIHTGIHTG